jgi:ABC-type nitrate/sulfonate/bicarbonate transport system substrate-binding protein
MMEPNVYAEDNGKTMLLRTRTAAVWVVICILAGTSLYGADRPITIGVAMDGSSQQDRAPLQAYLTKAMRRPVIIASPDLRDLRGKQFAFGDIDSTSAHLLPYHELKQAGIDPETDLKYRYTGSHLATAALVADGAVDAGAIDKTVLDFLITGGKLDGRKVRVFYTSKPYVDYVFVARKDVPEAERERFARGLLALKEGKDERVLKILRAHKFVVANDAEYAITRRIGHELGMF